MKKLIVTLAFIFAFGSFNLTSASNETAITFMGADCNAFADTVASDYSAAGGNYYDVYFKAMNLCVSINAEYWDSFVNN
jgi:hypothetical protein